MKVPQIKNRRLSRERGSGKPDVIDHPSAKITKPMCLEPAKVPKIKNRRLSRQRGYKRPDMITESSSKLITALCIEPVKATLNAQLINALSLERTTR